MKIAFKNENVVLWHGDCREVMAAMPAKSVDLLCTDPPPGAVARARADEFRHCQPKGSRFAEQ